MPTDKSHDLKEEFHVGTSVAFAGYDISQEGIRPDPKRTDAIRKFPSPKDVTDVCSFLGLANQLGQFIPDLAMATMKIRQLLKKGVAFQWLPEHEKELVMVKKLLISPMLVHYFCLLYTSPSPRDRQKSRMPSSA